MGASEISSAIAMPRDSDECHGTRRAVGTGAALQPDAVVVVCLVTRSPGGRPPFPRTTNP
jgi:hypothetical protein